jgi:hypothetical protein
MTTLRCVSCVALGWLSDDACVFVKNLQAVYKTTRMQTPKSQIKRCAYGHETTFVGIDDKSGFGVSGSARMAAWDDALYL